MSEANIKLAGTVQRLIDRVSRTNHSRHKFILPAPIFSTTNFAYPTFTNGRLAQASK